jgi:hypothetical protein
MRCVRGITSRSESEGLVGGERRSEASRGEVLVGMKAQRKDSGMQTACLLLLFHVTLVCIRKLRGVHCLGCRHSMA